MHRAALTSVARSYSAATTRTFSTSRINARKTVTDKVGEVAEKVNKTLGERLASAIKTGEQVTQKTRETVAGVKEDSVKKAGEAWDAAGQKSAEAREQAREAAKKVAGK